MDPSENHAPEDHHLQAGCMRSVQHLEACVCTMQLLVHTQHTHCVCTTQREVDENVYTQAAIDKTVYTQATHFCVYTKANAYARSIFATVHA